RVSNRAFSSRISRSWSARDQKLPVHGISGEYEVLDHPTGKPIFAELAVSVVDEELLDVAGDQRSHCGLRPCIRNRPGRPHRFEQDACLPIERPLLGGCAVVVTSFSAVLGDLHRPCDSVGIHSPSAIGSGALSSSPGGGWRGLGFDRASGG